MKEIKINSPDNKYSYCSGDYVYELGKAMEMTDEIVGFFLEYKIEWEATCFCNRFKSFALYNAPENTINNIAEEFVKKFKVNIIDQYIIVK